MNHIISKSLPICFLLLSLTVSNTKAQQPTWENGIACIIYSRCSPCHNPNGIAPFSLMSYEDALDHVYTIQYMVNSGQMPPYPPDISYQRYQNERYLSDSEKLAINQWINKNAPPGDLTKAPEPPKFDYKNEITDPDFSSAIPVFTVPAITEDLYRCFVMSNPFPEAKYISAIEVIPGNRNIVHHVHISQDTSNIPVILDAMDTLPGYSQFGGFGSPHTKRIAGWTPSAGALYFPENMVLRIEPKSRIIIQIHYPLASAGQVDSTRINFRFVDSPGKLRFVKAVRLLNADNTMTNGPLVIPANKVMTFYEQFQLPYDDNISLLGIAPHAHLVCVSMKAYAVKPAGDTVPLINIKHWNFHWQGVYLFKKMITLPGGSTLYGEAVFDNTANNPHNPNNPPKRVKKGKNSTDEMMAFHFLALRTRDGDENMVFDTTTRLPTYNDCGFVIRSSDPPVKETIVEKLSAETVDKPVAIYPNPVHDKLKLIFNGPKTAQVLVYDINGRLVYQASARPGNNQYDLQFLPNGYYAIRIVNTKVNAALKFVKQ